LTKTLLPDTPTTIGSWARFIARGLQGAGLDGKELFLEQGLDLSEADTPNTRFPVDAMSRVWRRAVELTGDEGFALKLADNADPSMYNALGLSMISSRTLGEALQRACRFSQVATDAGGQVLRERADGRMELVQEIFGKQHSLVTPYATEAFICTTVKILRSISNEQFRLLEVHFCHNQEALRERYETYFDAPVIFDSDEYKLVFERDLLDCPCEQANPALAENIDAWMRDYLTSFEPDTLASKVRILLAEKLPDGAFQQGEVASALAMSSRSLQRGLQREGVSFKELLEKTRQDLAMKYIGEKELSLVEVCLLLGFSDQSNFTRAFKRWTGKTPNAYRQDMAA
jgi:AraC-like DNA-binding protein